MSTKEMRSVRVLHVVGGMNRGGVETWLMHVLRHADRQRFRMDFLAHSLDRTAYDAEIESLGSAVISCLDPAHPLRYRRNLRRILRERGPYDIVHSHVHHYSGWVLRIARAAGVPVRVAHSHNDTALTDRAASFARHRYLRMMERWIRAHATHGLAASGKAAAALFGPGWRLDPRWRVLHYGVDLEPFRAPVDRAAVRAELGIPADALVLGHVGRFMEQKNHRFLVDIAAAVTKREPKMRLLLVGEGPLRSDIARRVAAAGLAGQVVFAGSRPDVPRLMRGAVDAFLLPSFHEGLPLVLIEAQAAGLPCVFSDTVTEEADAVRPLMRRLPLSAPAAAWAEVALQAARNPPATPQPEALRQLQECVFDIRVSAETLTTFYSQVTGRRVAA